jgi:hypothetical protein
MSSSDAERLSTAPKGNGTRLSHKYAPAVTAPSTVTTSVTFGEAERA